MFLMASGALMTFQELLTNWRRIVHLALNTVCCHTCFHGGGGVSSSAVAAHGVLLWPADEMHLRMYA